MKSTINQQYWNNRYRELQLTYDPNSILFKEIFDKYLKPEGTCFEVGCYPGNYLVYLGKKFDYTVSGIDKTSYIQDRLPVFLKSENVKVGNLFYGDFFDFTPLEKYDVVYSFGFLEHYLDLYPVIERHINLLKPSGILILACPNFTRGQYLFHRLFDTENLNRHCINTMSLPLWRDILKKNNMTILFDGYYKTIDFWTETVPKNQYYELVLKLIQFISKKIDNKINLPNRWFSPYLISVSKK